MRGTVFFVVVAAVVVLAILLLLRSRKLKEKYAALWVLVGAFCIVLVARPNLLTDMAHLVGIEVGSNLLFVLAILLLLGICLQLSLEVSSLEDKVRRLAEEAAMARQRLGDGPDRRERARAEISPPTAPPIDPASPTPLPDGRE